MGYYDSMELGWSVADNLAIDLAEIDIREAFTGFLGYTEEMVDSLEEKGLLEHELEMRKEDIENKISEQWLCFGYSSETKLFYYA